MKTFLLFIIAILLSGGISFAQIKIPSNTARVKVVINGKADSAEVFQSKKDFSHRISRTINQIPMNMADSSYYLSITNGKGFTYFTVSTISTKSFNSFIVYDTLIEDGDDVIITVNNGKITFSGKGSEKMNFKYNVFPKSERAWKKHFSDSLKASGYVQPPGYKGIMDTTYLAGFAVKLKHSIISFYSKINWQLKLLETHQAGLKSEIFDVLKNDIIGNYASELDFSYAFSYSQLGYNSSNTAFVAKTRERLYNIYKPFLDNIGELFNEQGKLYSVGFNQFVSNTAYNAPKFKQDTFNWIEENFNGELKERIITEVVSGNYKGFAQLDQKKILERVKATEYNQILLQLFSSLSPGSKAFNFSLKDTKGTTVTLEQFRGKTVVLDFWFTGCVNCYMLTPHLKEVMEEVKDDPDIVFVSISIDRNREQWIDTVNSHLYSSPGAIDLFTDGKGTNDPVITKYNVIGYPTLVIIGKDGKVISASPERPNNDQAKKKFIEMLRL